MLTPKQKALLDFIHEFTQTRGYAPSQQEIAQHFGFKSLGTVQDYLVRLERQGALGKVWNARRSLTTRTDAQHKVSSRQPAAQVIPATATQRSVPLPLSGRVAAGKPIEAVNDSPDAIDVPASMLGRGEHFVLQVSGNSMFEDGILDQDYVVIKKQPYAENGQTVVALINHEATIKTYYRRARQIELHPANPQFQPIVIRFGDSAGQDHDQDHARDPVPDFRIEGILVGLLRNFRKR